MKPANHANSSAPQSGRRSYRVERRFCGERHVRELVQSLLRAHL